MTGFTFQIGDVVKRCDGKTFSTGQSEATVDTVSGDSHGEERVGIVHGGWLRPEELLLVDRAVAEPAPVKLDQDFKADAGKLDWTLLMGGDGLIRTLEGIVRVLNFAVKPKAEGGKGYEKHSWRQVPRAKERYRAALHRHLAEIEKGNLIDPESGESHWYHVGCCSLFLAELENEDAE